MPIQWQGNVKLELGTAFFLFLAVALILFFLWRKVGSERLSQMLSASFSPSRGSGRYVYSKN